MKPETVSEDVEPCKKCGGIPTLVELKFDTRTEMDYCCFNCLKSGNHETAESLAIKRWNDKQATQTKAGDVEAFTRVELVKMAEAIRGVINELQPKITHLQSEKAARAAIAAMPQASELDMEAVCVGCEGNPAPENSPCGVCGLTLPPSNAVDVVRQLRDALDQARIHIGYLAAGAEKDRKLTMVALSRADEWLKEGK